MNLDMKKMSKQLGVIMPMYFTHKPDIQALENYSFLQMTFNKGLSQILQVLKRLQE